MNKEVRTINKKIFEIVRIKSGWFDVAFSNGLDKISLTNSWYLGNNAPKILLSNLIALYNGKNEVWLCWHEEPGAYILHLKKIKNTVTINISTAVKSSLDLYYEGDILKDEELDEYLITIPIPFVQFVKEIYLEFYSYSFGSNLKVYEKEWGTFPMDEYKNLKKLIEVM